MADETTTPTSEPTPETKPETTAENASTPPEGGEATTAVAEAPAAESAEKAGEKDKLKQEIEIREIGPCKKHIKVIVDRAQIDERFNEKYTEILRSEQPQVRGFRPRKAPRKLIERQYHDSVSEEVKTQVLMASLEQLADEQRIAPLSPPDLDPHAIFIPREGPFIYEFDIEVRPEFDVPNYKGLHLKRPIHTFTPTEIEEEKKRLLEPYGQLVPKEGDPPTVALNDVVTVDVAISFQGREINKLTERRIKVEKQFALADGVAPDFGAKMAGAKAGEQRMVEITLSQEIESLHFRGQKVQALFTIHDIKETRMPEVTRDLLEDVFGVSTIDAFNDFVQIVLERRLEYTQRQEARKQVLEQLAISTNWELPQDLLRRQASRTLSRRLLEMRNAGMSEEQIKGRRRLLEQDVLKNTANALKEHFVLQKIAELEDIEIEDDDIDKEIERIADRNNESFRKVKARMEKEDMLETIAADVLEQKALDLILNDAVYEDYEWNAEQESGEVSTVSADAVPESEAKAEVQAEETTEEKSAEPAAGS
ncbi:MAG TPA: trigger factor [Gemmata sp.]|nr:trigger factor [Gemmata sp.]